MRVGIVFAGAIVLILLSSRLRDLVGKLPPSRTRRIWWDSTCPQIVIHLPKRLIDFRNDLVAIQLP
jgi:hypothetical protein